MWGYLNWRIRSYKSRRPAANIRKFTNKLNWAFDYIEAVDQGPHLKIAINLAFITQDMRFFPNYFS
jgi:hypothetical protein